VTEDHDHKEERIGTQTLTVTQRRIQEDEKRRHKEKKVVKKLAVDYMIQVS
jgi:hypothetical protein